MPSLGTVRTLDLDLQSWTWDNLLLLMTRPTGGEPSTLPGPGQQDVDVLHIPEVLLAEEH